VIGSQPRVPTYTVVQLRLRKYFNENLKKHTFKVMLLFPYLLDVLFVVLPSILSVEEFWNQKIYNEQ
jgi:hypothetical protein